jgi:hypothetical protein
VSRLLRCAAWLLTASCAPQSAAWNGATPETWPQLRAELARLRLAAPEQPWTARLRVTMREPVSGRVVGGRGGIAVAPGRAVRLIMLGGAATTWLDAWVTPARWRVAVPPLGLVRRGGAEPAPGLPVSFLRWWFFRRFEGRLFAASADPSSPTWLLRDGGAVVELRALASAGADAPSFCPRGAWMAATRRDVRKPDRREGADADTDVRKPDRREGADANTDAGRTERIEVCDAEGRGPAGGPSQPGERVRYVDEGSGLAVDILIEALAPGPPPAEAFDDPDEGPARSTDE